MRRLSPATVDCNIDSIHHSNQSSNMIRLFLILLLFGIRAASAEPVVTPGSKTLPLPGESFSSMATMPSSFCRRIHDDIPWVWNLNAAGTPAQSESWMFQRFSPKASRSPASTRVNRMAVRTGQVYVVLRASRPAAAVSRATLPAGPQPGRSDALQLGGEGTRETCVASGIYFVLQSRQLSRSSRAPAPLN